MRVMTGFCSSRIRSQLILRVSCTRMTDYGHLSPYALCAGGVGYLCSHVGSVDCGATLASFRTTNVRERSRRPGISTLEM